MRTVQPGTYELLFDDGSIRLMERNPKLATIKKELGAESLDTVNLRNGCVMLVDDTGKNDGRPVNKLATELYHEICKPGTTHEIRGDVAIVLDSDFA